MCPFAKVPDVGLLAWLKQLITMTIHWGRLLFNIGAIFIMELFTLWWGREIMHTEFWIALVLTINLSNEDIAQVYAGLAYLI